MAAEGYSRAEQARILGISVRQVQHIIATTQASGHTVLEIPEAISLDDLPDDVRPLVEPTGDAFKLFFERFSRRPLPKHAQDWVQGVLDYPNLIINTPPRHAKTEILAVWFPIWLVAKDRDEKIIIISETQAGALKSLKKIAIELEGNVDLLSTFGKFKSELHQSVESWAPGQGHLTVSGRVRPSGDPSVIALGSGQQVLGREATVLVADDITNARISQSSRENDNLEQWLREEALSRIMPGGKAVLIGQRVHFDDISSRMQAVVYPMGALKGQPVWHTITQPAVLEWPSEPGKPGTVLWPEERPWAYMEDVFARVGSAQFETMYQQNPSSAENVVFQREWFAACYDPSRVKGEGVDGAVRVLSLDPASDSDNALVCVDIVQADDAAPVFHVVDALKFRAQLSELMVTVDDWFSAYRPDYFVFEKSSHSGYAMQTEWFQRLRRHARVIIHKTGYNKHDPLVGLASVSVPVEQARLRLPTGDKASLAMSQALTEELCSWYPKKRKDYDTLAALWFICYNIKRFRRLDETRYEDYQGGIVDTGWGYLRLAHSRQRRIPA